LKIFSSIVIFSPGGKLNFMNVDKGGVQPLIHPSCGSGLSRDYAGADGRIVAVEAAPQNKTM